MADSDVHLVLMALYKQQGPLTVEMVVNAASAPEHPLHGHFTWDDSEAGRKLRLSEATELVRNTE